MNLNVNVENHGQNVHGSVSKAAVIEAIRRAAEGRFASVTEAALTIKGRIVATQPVLADREDVEMVHRVLLGEWDIPLTAEETAAREYYLASSKEEQAILRLLLQVSLRNHDIANRMREERMNPNAEQHPEAVAPALNKAIADIHMMLKSRVA